jgi:hypothetical protein
MPSQLRRTLLSTERAKAFRKRTIFRAEPKGPCPGVDFSSSGRHSPSPLRSGGRCSPGFVERFSAFNGLKHFVSAPFSEPSPRAPAPGSTSAAAALDGRNFTASAFSSERSPRAPDTESTVSGHAAGAKPPSPPRIEGRCFPSSVVRFDFTSGPRRSRTPREGKGFSPGVTRKILRLPLKNAASGSYLESTYREGHDMLMSSSPFSLTKFVVR